MAMQVFGVQVCRHHDLITLSPNLVCKLHSDFLCKLRRDVLLLKTQVSVVGLYAVLFAVALLYGHELVTGSLRIAVDTLNIKLLLRFFLVLCVVNHISERLILCFGINNPHRSLFGIGRIVNDLSEPSGNRP